MSVLDTIDRTTRAEIAAAENMCSSCGKEPALPGFLMCVGCRVAAHLPVDPMALIAFRKKSEAETVRRTAQHQRFHQHKAAKKAEEEKDMKKEFTCECGRSFDTKASLGQHRRRCNGSAPDPVPEKAPEPNWAVCDDCGKASPEIAHLFNHWLGEVRSVCIACAGHDDYLDHAEPSVDAEQRVLEATGEAHSEPVSQDFDAPYGNVTLRNIIDQPLKFELLETRLRLVAAILVAEQVPLSARMLIENELSRAIMLLAEVRP